MNSSLILEYEYSQDDDDFGWLKARVHTPDFSGRNAMWVQWQDIGDFAQSLCRYPIRQDDPVSCEWGFTEQGHFTEVTKLSIAPTGTTGGLGVDVLLANYCQTDNRCRTRFETDYPSLSEFRKQIELMMIERTGAATLEGSKSEFR